MDIRKPMFSALAKAGYPILQLKSMDLSLEDIFIKLVEDKKRERNPQNKTPKKVSAEAALNVSGGSGAAPAPDAQPTAPAEESKEGDL